ncbi:methylmalonyl-CoA mutase cobalamin-binding subunit [Streptomyces demainii]|uniref:Methylmalonyl-CoA mutase cobalamin-binding subunit n=1 Tax=Streptomyces demainii TaxID=588122 RepID=A0ABT9L5H3_9ACTN|nr:methylmalonyl-CoA mutase cobalamin-binding subunit [Streptomyces demainii]
MNPLPQRTERAGAAPVPRARVVIARPGRDGRDRGAGREVIRTVHRLSPAPSDTLERTC